MNKLSIFLFLAFAMFSCTEQTSRKPIDHTKKAPKIDKHLITNAIDSIMQSQEKAWNQGSIVDFMNGYWESDSLQFIGNSGINYGWQPTLDNYLKSYPDATSMGKLTFDNLHIDVLDENHVHVTGKWLLEREIGNLSGHYTLLWKKIGGEWVIIKDHSS